VRPRRSAALVLGLAALVFGACRSVAPPAPLPANWHELITAPAPFSALYRLTCCGHRDLVLVARSDGGRLSISVTVPPGGVALAAWVDEGGGWMRRDGEGCREPLPEGVLPLSGKVSLPLEPELAARLLSGVLPEGAREVSEAPGWVEGADAGWWWRARIEGAVPRCVRAMVGRQGSRTLALEAQLGDPRGRVPGRLTLKAGSVKAELALQEWREGGTVSPPGWLSTPACTGRS